MSTPITLIQGPGSHSDLVNLYLDKTHQSYDTFHYWPKYVSMRKLDGKKLYSGSRLFDWATYVGYGINHRLSYFNHGRQFHKDFLFRLYDRLCSKQIVRPSSLIAWSQTSLETINKNRALGGKSILEHPMPHVNHWMEVNRGFYRDASIKNKPGFSRFSRAMEDRMKRECEVSNYIQVHSSFVKSTLLDNGIPESKILICPLGIDENSFKIGQQSKVSRKKLTLLYVGRFELWKGVHILLESVDKFPESEIELVMVGRVLSEIEPFLKKYKKNVTVLKPIHRVHLSQVFNQADIFIFPSLNDAYGMVLLEAMLHGLPVIGSEFSAAPDLISDNQNGWIIKDCSVAGLVETISYALQNKDRLVEMGQFARRGVLEKHTLSHYFKRLEENLIKVGFIDA